MARVHCPPQDWLDLRPNFLYPGPIPMARGRSDALWRELMNRYPVVAFADPKLDDVAEWTDPVRWQQLKTRRDMGQGVLISTVPHIDPFRFVLRRVNPARRAATGFVEPAPALRVLLNLVPEFIDSFVDESTRLRLRGLLFQYRGHLSALEYPRKLSSAEFSEILKSITQLSWYFSQSNLISDESLQRFETALHQALEAVSEFYCWDRPEDRVAVSRQVLHFRFAKTVAELEEPSGLERYPFRFFEDPMPIC